MIVRVVATDGDWLFGKGRNDYYQNNAAITQNISTRLKSFLGDCFFAQDAGIDWFNLLGSKNQLALELSIRATILNTAGVVGIVRSSVTFSSITREINIQYTVNTIYTVDSSTGVPIESTSSFLLTQDGNILTTEDGSGLVLG